MSYCTLNLNSLYNISPSLPLYLGGEGTWRYEAIDGLVRFQRIVEYLCFVALENLIFLSDIFRICNQIRFVHVYVFRGTLFANTWININDVIKVNWSWFMTYLSSEICFFVFHNIFYLCLRTYLSSEICFYWI